MYLWQALTRGSCPGNIRFIQKIFETFGFAIGTQHDAFEALDMLMQVFKQQLAHTEWASEIAMEFENTATQMKQTNYSCRCQEPQRNGWQMQM